MKLKKVPPTTRARFTTPSTPSSTIALSPIGPLVCWSYKEPGHSRVSYREPKIVLTIANGNDDLPELEVAPETVTVSHASVEFCFLNMSYTKEYKSLPYVSK